MAIKGLTTQAASLPPIIGKLRKGGVKPKSGDRPGEELQHFRFTPRNEQAVELAQAFARVYGDAPQRLQVYLPANDVDLVFEAWREIWNASELTHRCDGEFLVERDRYTGELYPTNTPCPFGGQEGDDKKGCKAVGRLSVILPELLAEGHYGAVTVETHSINDIATLHRALTDFRARFGQLTAIPFYVFRYPEKISTPGGKGGKRQRYEKWLVGIEPGVEFVARQLEMARQQALAAPDALPALPAPSVDRDTGEVIDHAPHVDLREKRKEFHGLGELVHGKEAWREMGPTLIEEHTDGRTSSSMELTEGELDALIRMLQDDMVEDAAGEGGWREEGERQEAEAALQ